jgi:formylglycine-generating enzyme required for sulfatase activity
MMRYPVTNSQYRPFVDAGAYLELRWWSAEGQKWLRESRVSEPEFWHSAKWNGPNQPVVGVSFCEAEAFCNWAGCRLPSDDEWLIAAGGSKLPTFPWGDDSEEGICNSAEVGLGTTSPVGFFPRSRARAFGFDDMAGNVWEWTTTSERTLEGLHQRICGGGWGDNVANARLDDETCTAPDAREPYIGFRALRIRVS